MTFSELMINKPVSHLTPMILSWLFTNVIWLSLAFLISSVIFNQRHICGLGWALFSIHWLKQPAHYLEIGDHFNVVLTIAVAISCLYMSWRILKYRHISPSCVWVSFAVAVGGLFYYPFVQFAALEHWLISQTAHLTHLLLGFFGFQVFAISESVLSFNGHSVQIILACTAIQSMAFFSGLILSVRAPLGRKMVALMASVPTIYFLNLFRNVFVIVACGDEWFGSNSFYWAHNVVAKVGSAAALFVIAYVVLMILPELLNMIDELFTMIRPSGGKVS